MKSVWTQWYPLKCRLAGSDRAQPLHMSRTGMPMPALTLPWASGKEVERTRAVVWSTSKLVCLEGSTECHSTCAVHSLRFPGCFKGHSGLWIQAGDSISLFHESVTFLPAQTNGPSASSFVLENIKVLIFTPTAQALRVTLVNNSASIGLEVCEKCIY